MSWKESLLIFTLSFLTLGIFTYFQSAPGYMDAEYYLAMGLRIARDHSMSEPFAWNYLNPFSGLPQPGFAFWMPLPAFFAALGMKVTGWFSFIGARIIFHVISAFVPVLTGKIAYRISGKKNLSILAGLFGCFPAFYAPFLTTSDGFGIVMILGGGFLLTAIQKNFQWKYIILGILAGLMHLSRTDGFLWMVAGILIVIWSEKVRLMSIAKLLLGYLGIMTPWFARNWRVFGNILSPGSSKMLWLTNYNDLFLFKTDQLNFTNWISKGIWDFVVTYSSAFISNIETAIVIQGQIILIPIILIGLYKYRKNETVRALFVTWILMLVLMSVIFPFAGTRGGFFHSGAAFQPFIWVFAAIGLAEVIEWGKVKRNWNYGQGQMILGIGLTLLLAGMTFFVLQNRVIGDKSGEPQWNYSYLAALEVDDTLGKLEVPRDAVLMINNPPGLYIATGRVAVVIPSDNPDEVLNAASATGAHFLILEQNHPESLDDLYLNPTEHPELEYLKTQSGVHYFWIP